MRADGRKRGGGSGTGTTPFPSSEAKKIAIPVPAPQYTGFGGLGSERGGGYSSVYNDLRHLCVGAVGRKLYLKHKCINY